MCGNFFWQRFIAVLIWIFSKQEPTLSRNLDGGFLLKMKPRWNVQMKETGIRLQERPILLYWIG